MNDKKQHTHRLAILTSGGDAAGIVERVGEEKLVRAGRQTEQGLEVRRFLGEAQCVCADPAGVDGVGIDGAIYL